MSMIDELLSNNGSYAASFANARLEGLPLKPAKRLAVYDTDLIRFQLTAIVRERAQWEAFFARAEPKTDNRRDQAMPSRSEARGRDR